MAWIAALPGIIAAAGAVYQGFSGEKARKEQKKENKKQRQMELAQALMNMGQGVAARAPSPIQVQPSQGGNAIAGVGAGAGSAVTGYNQQKSQQLNDLLTQAQTANQTAEAEQRKKNPYGNYAIYGQGE